MCFAVYKHVNTTASLAGFETINRKSQANKLRIFKMPTSVRHLGAISYAKPRLLQIDFCNFRTEPHQHNSWITY
jgi:hypothetical protein